MRVSSGPQNPPRTLPWVSASHGKSEFLRLRGVADALVRIAEHAGAIPVRFWTRPPILVARLGGDEFVVLLPALRDAQR